jgi:MFS family permease
LPLTALQLQASGYPSGLIGALMALHALGLMLAVAVTERAVAGCGARHALILASLATALTVALMQAASSPLALGLGLIVLGGLAGLAFNLVEAWVNDIVPQASRGRWLAIHCTLFTLCQLGGPLMLEVLPRPFAYLITGGLLLASLPALAALSPRRFEAVADAGPTAWWHLLGTAPGIVAGTLLFALFDALVLGMLPVYARLHGLTESEALRSASVVLLGDTALEWLVGVLADRLGRLRVQRVCALCLLGMAPLLPLAIGHTLWWPLLFLIGGAAGGIYVLSLMACGQRFTGRRLLQMTALLGAGWGAASCVGPALTGVLMALSQSWALPGVLLVCTLGLLLAMAWEERQLRLHHRVPA